MKEEKDKDRQWKNRKTGRQTMKEEKDRKTEIDSERRE